jgi:predicted metal-dependent enzyme (double-stranded beta helix superfamily)
MRATSNYSRCLEELILKLEIATLPANPRKAVLTVKEVLEETVRQNANFLPAEFTQPAKGSYARRLVHEDPKGRFTLMAMVWDKGQATPLHDHDGLWVVECVYSGRMQVTNYALDAIRNGIYHFHEEYSEECVPGEADYRIPPFEHHVLANVQETPSVTLHVFGGALRKCQVFEPVPGGYVPSEKALALTA